MRILITSGPTSEPIDGVRYITNFSSGKTGNELAKFFKENNHEVWLVQGWGSNLPPSGKYNYEFKTFEELDNKLKELLNVYEFDVVIHLAAVSDYSVDKLIVNGQEEEPGVSTKIPSSSELQIKLKRNYKIIQRLKTYSRKRDTLVVGFKLTNSDDAETRKKAVERLFLSGNPDFVVHNDLSEIDPSSNYHRAKIFSPKSCLKIVSNKAELGQALLEILEDARDTMS
jgi:phosphopantothenoylcysteine synthetase/decarboxylase